MSPATPTTDVESFVTRTRDRIDAQQRSLSRGEVVTENLPAVLGSLSSAHDDLARAHAALGETEASRQAYAQAAVYALSASRESVGRREMLPPERRADSPTILGRGLECALLSGGSHLVDCLGRAVLDMDERFLVESDRRSFYGTTTLGALALDDERRLRRAREEFRVAVDDDAETAAALRNQVYAAIAEGNLPETVRAIENVLERPAIFGDADAPDLGVFDLPAALCRLAARRGVDVSVSAPNVPTELVDSGDETTVARQRRDQETPPDARNRVDVFPGTDGEDRLVVARIEVGDRHLTADVLPETDVGTLLSDDWMEATAKQWLSAPDDQRVATGEKLLSAIEEGSVRRRLVVESTTDSPSGHRVDRSIFEAGIDEVELVD